MGGVTYDTGAPLAAERDNRQMWALHAVVTSNMTHIRMVADATGARPRIESI